MLWIEKRLNITQKKFKEEHIILDIKKYIKECQNEEYDNEDLDYSEMLQIIKDFEILLAKEIKKSEEKEKQRESLNNMVVKPFFMSDKEWFYYDEDEKMLKLTEKAPEKARESYNMVYGIETEID